MDSRFGISYYEEPYNPYNIDNIISKYIWFYDTFSHFNKCSCLDEKHLVVHGRIGGLYMGEIYKVNKTELLEIIKNNDTWFKDFDYSFLKEGYYYFVWEDWS